MKKLDIVVMVLFVAGLICFCFYRECRLDVYFLVLGFAVAIMSIISMLIQWRKDEQADAKEYR